MTPRLRAPTRLVKRVIESCAFWLAALNGVQCLYFVHAAVLDAHGWFAHRTGVYPFGSLSSVQDAFLRVVVWLVLLRWAESEDGAEADEDPAFSAV